MIHIVASRTKFTTTSIDPLFPPSKLDRDLDNDPGSLLYSRPVPTTRYPIRGEDKRVLPFRGKLFRGVTSLTKGLAGSSTYVDSWKKKNSRALGA